MSDPTNPAHYAGRACADIGERLTANGYQILKYVWRLGKKDGELTELGKAIWYADSECQMFANLAAHGIEMRTAPLVFDIPDQNAFLQSRLAGQSLFTQQIARMLWAGYNRLEIEAIMQTIAKERFRRAGA